MKKGCAVTVALVSLYMGINTLVDRLRGAEIVFNSIICGLFYASDWIIFISINCGGRQLRRYGGVGFGYACSDESSQNFLAARVRRQSSL